MSRHPQRQPPPGYLVTRSPEWLQGWMVYQLHPNLDGFTIADARAGPYTRRYNAVAAAQRAYLRDIPTEGTIPWTEQEKQP